MIKRRILKEMALCEVIDKYSAQPYIQQKAYQRSVQKAHNQRDDLWAWFTAAFIALGEDEWDRIIRQPLNDLDGISHCLLDTYHSSHMSALVDGTDCNVM